MHAMKACLSLAAAFLAATGSAHAQAQRETRDVVRQIYCECACAGGNVSESFTYEAPNGDPGACGKLNNTRCSNDNAQQVLQKCEGRAVKPGDRGMAPRKQPKATF